MPYRILSMDGGGSWAMIQARVLRDLYGNVRGHEVLRQFDLAIGNSGGSLVLAALCNNMWLDEIIRVFEEEGQRKQVFSKMTLMEKLQDNVLSLIQKHTGIGPKYKTERKYAGLKNVLSTHDELFKSGKIPQPVATLPLNKIPDLIGRPIDLVIVGFDYFRERASFFRSNPLSNTDKFKIDKQGGNRFYEVSLLDAIHASSNAPLNYFDAPAAVQSILRIGGKEDKRRGWYWDGAVSGFNNPVLAGVIEAMTNGKGRQASDFQILSIGTGLARKAVIVDYKDAGDEQARKIWQRNQDNPFVRAKAEFKFAKDISKMASSILSDPPDAASFMAYSILDPGLENKANIIRINPCISPELNEQSLIYEVPPIYKGAEDRFEGLLKLDMDAVEEDEIALLKELCDKFISPPPGKPGVPNQLIRGDHRFNQFWIGQPTYAEAKQRWLTAIGATATPQPAAIV